MLLLLIIWNKNWRSYWPSLQ